MNKILLILLLCPFLVRSQTPITGSVIERDPTAQFSQKTTDSLREGANLYFTDSRARRAIKSAGIIIYDSIQGIISIPISQADINKWNAGGTTSGLIITAADTALWNQTTSVGSVGTGFKIVRFNPNKDTMFLATIKEGPGIAMSYNLDSSLTISASGAASPTPKARIITATTGAIALDDNVVIYNGTAAATFTITAGSTQGRTLKISNNSTFAIKVGIYTIPAKSWREWVWLSSINDWFQFQSGLVL